MVNAAAAAYIANTNAAAQDWARARHARTMVRAAMNSSEVIYCRTWPSLEMMDPLHDFGHDPKLACNGWLDSTLDLRDGLSVVEVFAAGEEPEAVFEDALAVRR